MAASFTCDGCGVSVDKPKVIGHVTRRDYCEECAEKAAAFLDAEEKDRVAAVKEFVKKRDQLIKKYGKDGFKLPDVV